MRGAFGTLLRKTARQHHGSYERLFEPSVAIAPSPSGLADWPRPFVFRSRHLDGFTFAPGDHFYFDINLFDTDPKIPTLFEQTFDELTHAGLGPHRRKIELTGMADSGLIVVDLIPSIAPVSSVCLEFLTPTELKTNNGLADRPYFDILGTRLRDRISTLRQLYAEGPLDIDFVSFGANATQVQLTHCSLIHHSASRRSSRTGQTHPLGGFTGTAEYRGDLTSFLPYLRLAKWIGVGRQTVWGKGEIAVIDSH